MSQLYVNSDSSGLLTLDGIDIQRYIAKRDTACFTIALSKSTFGNVKLEVLGEKNEVIQELTPISSADSDYTVYGFINLSGENFSLDILDNPNGFGVTNLTVSVNTPTNQNPNVSVNVTPTIPGDQSKSYFTTSYPNFYRWKGHTIAISSTEYKTGVWSPNPNGTIPFATVNGYALMNSADYFSYVGLPANEFSSVFTPITAAGTDDVTDIANQVSPIPKILSPIQWTTLRAKYKEVVMSGDPSQLNYFKNILNYYVDVLSRKNSNDQYAMEATNAVYSYIVNGNNATVNCNVNQLNAHNVQYDNTIDLGTVNYTKNFNDQSSNWYISTSGKFGAEFNLTYTNEGMSNVNVGRVVAFTGNLPEPGSFSSQSNQWIKYTNTVTHPLYQFVYNSSTMWPINNDGANWPISDDNTLLYYPYLPPFSVSVASNGGFSFLNNINQCIYSVTGNVTETYSSQQVFYDVMSHQLEWKNGYSTSETATLDYMVNALDMSISNDLSVGLTVADTELELAEVNYQIGKITSKIEADSDEDDLEKLAQYWYDMADLMVSGYYEMLLSKMEYIKNSDPNSTNPTLIQRLITWAQKFNYTEPLLTDWVSEYPFKIPSSNTQELVKGINAQLPPTVPQFTTDDVVNAAQTFFETYVPDGLNPYQLADSNTLNQLTSAISLYNAAVDDSSKKLSIPSTSDNSNKPKTTPDSNDALPWNVSTTQAVTIFPNQFRISIMKCMSMGAFLQYLHTYLHLLASHETAFANNSTGQTAGLPSIMENENPSSRVSLDTIGHMNLNNLRTQMDQHVSDVTRNLIYPMFDSIIEDVESDISALKDLTEDRLHGLQFTIYHPEVKELFTTRTKVTHDLVHLFLTGLKVGSSLVAPILDGINAMNKKVLGLVDTVFLKPLPSIALSLVKSITSIVLDMTSLVSPGSEILELMEDEHNVRPLPYPLSPFANVGSKDGGLADNRPFAHVTMENGFNSTIAAVECVVPYQGLCDASASNCGVVSQTTDTFGNPIFSIKVNDITISNVTPGVHYHRLMTRAGTVTFWYSINYYYDSSLNKLALIPGWDGHGFSDSVLPGSGTKTKCMVCFIPDMICGIDGKVSLPKSFHKWILCALAVPGWFFTISQSANYVANVKSLEQLPGFEGYSSHISIHEFNASCAADGMAGSVCLGAAIGSMILSGNEKQSLELGVMSFEDALNATKIGMAYTKSKALNVLDTYVNYTSTINNVLASAWPNSSDAAAYNSNMWMLFNRHDILEPNMDVPGWYDQDQQRLLGDILLGVAKMGFWLYMQHRVFKKWSRKKAPVVQTKTKLRSVLWNHIKTKRMEKGAGKDAAGASNKMKAEEKTTLHKEDEVLDNSFLLDKNELALREMSTKEFKDVKDVYKETKADGKIDKELSADNKKIHDEVKKALKDSKDADQSSKKTLKEDLTIAKKVGDIITGISDAAKAIKLIPSLLWGLD